MNRKRTTRLALVLAFAFGGTAHALPYAIDDGVAETVLGTVQNSDLLWLNSFETQPGGEIITTLSAQWGLVPSFTGADLPVSLLLYNDPSNDGNPSDAVLLTSVATTATQYGTGNFVDMAITPTEVSGTFFVAALLEDAPDGSTFMAPIDLNSPAGRSWSLSGNIDINDLSGALNLPNGVNPPTDGNFMLRAVGVPIPEPATLLLVCVGAAGLAGFRRRRKGAAG